MTVLRFEKKTKLVALYDELLAAGIEVERLEGDDSFVAITVPEGQAEPPVAAVVAAHDAGAPHASESVATNAAAVERKLQDALAAADTHITNIAAASPTAAQQKAALLFSLRAVKALLRRELQAFDAAD